MYLTHLAVLGLLHGAILGADPEGGSAARRLVALAAVPATVAVGCGPTRLVERPLTEWGRSSRWG